MKKEIITFLVLAIIASPVFSADSCKVAWPQTGAISCEEKGANAYDSHDYGISQATFVDPNYIFVLPCISHCRIDQLSDVIGVGKARCPQSIQMRHEEAYIFIQGSGAGAVTFSSKSSFPNSYSWERGQTLQINEYCVDEAPFVGGRRQLETAGVYWKENKISLYDANPDQAKIEVDGSDGCQMHAVVQKYAPKQVTNGQIPKSWIDDKGSNQGSLPQNFEPNLNRLTNLEPGQTIQYFYKWIEVPGINVAYNRQGAPVGYCGGTSGNRKFYDYSQVSTQEGCYLIPTSIQKDVECCYPTDCIWKGASLTCDTSTFSCSDKKPCDSDIECQAGEPVCNGKTKTEWKCDLTQQWYPKKGTCVQTTSSVDCCSPSDCGDTRTYTCANNKCIIRQDLLQCPANTCCKSGGTYLPQDCPVGLKCCADSGVLSGPCKISCEPVQQKTDQLQGGVGSNTQPPTDTQLTNPPSGGSNIWIWVIVLILLIAGGIGAYYYYMKKQDSEPEEKEVPSGKAKCKKCGASLAPKLKYCTQCGEKIS